MERKITVRNPKFSFVGNVPKYWWAGRALPTHLANGLNLVFPEGERFFIRSVRAFSKNISDPKLSERVAGFIAQEVQHGREHESFFDTLRAEGYSIDRYLKFYTAFSFGFIEKISTRRLNLATTAALEHYTATIAENLLKDSFFKETANTTMRDLFYWHAAEEIEHKSVAFDVMTYANVSYFTRVSGMLMATALLGGFWLLGTCMFMVQDREFSFKKLIEQTRQGFKFKRFQQYKMGHAIKHYLKRDFHPNQTGNETLADSFLETFNPSKA